VRDLGPGEYARGNNEIYWDGKNQAGEPVASGVYIYRLRAVSRAGEEAQDFGKCAALR
jgi:flagellar hook assembly protein FlgD